MDIKRESRFNLFSEFDFTGENNTWEINNGSIVRNEEELGVREALEAGGAWAYKEGQNVYIDNGDSMLHSAIIVERRPNLKYAVQCSGSPVLHEIDEADIIDTDNQIFE